MPNYFKSSTFPNISRLAAASGARFGDAVKFIMAKDWAIVLRRLDDYTIESYQDKGLSVRSMISVMEADFPSTEVGSETGHDTYK